MHRGHWRVLRVYDETINLREDEKNGSLSRTLVTHTTPHDSHVTKSGDVTEEVYDAQVLQERIRT